MISTETRMICKSIDELTREMKKLRKTVEMIANRESETLTAEMEEPEDTPPPTTEGI